MYYKVCLKITLYWLDLGEEGCVQNDKKTDAFYKKDDTVDCGFSVSVITKLKLWYMVIA